MMNKTVLINGCSAGIGKATALYFAKHNYNIVAIMKSLTVTGISNLPDYAQYQNRVLKNIEKSKAFHIIGVLLMVLSAGSVHAQWTNLGLNAYRVNDVSLYADTLYASTDKGLYKKNIFNTDTSWMPCGLQGHYIVQTLVENNQSFISLVQLGSSLTTQIYKSDDGGNSFELLNTDTSNVNGYQFLDHIAHPPDNYDTLYLLNHQLKTYDGGNTWENINNTVQTDRFITVNPAGHSEIIIGGETGFLSPYLQYSGDYGNSWTFAAMNAFFDGDNAIHDLAIDSETWYAAGEGVIAKTTDKGENWEQLVNLWEGNSTFSLYYTNIEFSPIDNSSLYVSGFKSTGSGEVPLLITDNQGASWDSVSCNSITSNQQIRCLSVKNINNTDHVFLGGNGVYKYSRNLNKVLDTRLNAGLVIYPNPAHSVLYIKTEKTISGIKVYNALQKEVEVNRHEANSLNLSSLPRGLYFITITIKDKNFTRKFIKP